MNGPAIHHILARRPGLSTRTLLNVREEPRLVTAKRNMTSKASNVPHPISMVIAHLSYA